MYGNCDVWWIVFVVVVVFVVDVVEVLVVCMWFGLIFIDFDVVILVLIYCNVCFCFVVNVLLMNWIMLLSDDVYIVFVVSD